ncbi:hypothetical protein B9479_007287 [Cryptococcus floricola]|uniref:Spt20-like SEP domain-containing protein n=1 Tax=Cryptococcus floricola TaxID=2591691 RepID=A0A5D3AKQ7_9TREE|nr:hypothetical protein B9479_007287 [Cryptococcus floricola]
MASASGYNHHRFARAVLKKSRKWEPSLTVQLHANHWRFENSPMNFQYEGPMKPFLLAVRSQVIPASLIPFLYDIQPPISFVDGCLVVELQDFRRTPESRSRVVMRPAAETLPQTIDVMLERKGQAWDDQLALELESRIIAATSPPLYLGTSIMATRNASLALSITSPAHPNLSSEGSLRQPLSAESDQASSLDRMRKLVLAGSSQGSGAAPFQPDWLVLRSREQFEAMKMARDRGFAPPGSQGPGSIGPRSSVGPGMGLDGKDDGGKRKGKKRPGEEDEAEVAKPKSKKKKKNPQAAVEVEDKKRPPTKKGGDKKKASKKKDA